jgi:hypothetical protein
MEDKTIPTDSGLNSFNLCPRKERNFPLSDLWLHQPLGMIQELKVVIPPWTK